MPASETRLAPDIPGCPPPPAEGVRRCRERGEGGAVGALGSSREVLAQLLEGDPLGLRPRVGERLRQRRLLIDPEGALLRTLARLAQRAARKRARILARRPTDRWLRERIDEAIDSLLGETEPGALDAVRGPAHACAEFNRLPFPTRESFFRLVLEECSLDQLARTSPHSATDLARQARRALQLFLDHPPEETVR